MTGGTSRSTSEVYPISSDGTPLTWTVYAPSGTGPWPAVLVIHGGRFVGGDPEDAGVNGSAQDSANAGFIAFAIDYRLAPPGSIPGQKSSGRFPEQYDEVHLAVQAARNDARGNGQVCAVGGWWAARAPLYLAITNWQDAQAADIMNTGLAPTDAREAAIFITLAPGNYTTLLSDAEGAIGVGLLEI